MCGGSPPDLRCLNGPAIRMFGVATRSTPVSSRPFVLVLACHRIIQFEKIRYKILHSVAGYRCHASFWLPRELGDKNSAYPEACPSQLRFDVGFQLAAHDGIQRWRFVLGKQLQPYLSCSLRTIESPGLLPLRQTTTFTNAR